MRKALLAVVLVLFVYSPPIHGADVTISDAAKELGLKAGDIKKVRAGRIVSKTRTEASNKELCVVVVAVFDMPLGKLKEFVLEGDVLQVDPSIKQIADLGSKPTEEGFKQLGFMPNESDEVEILLEIEAGDDVNLHNSEIALFQALGRRYDYKVTSRSRLAVSDTYRRILWNRCKAYCEKGLAGIKPYSRDEDDEVK